MYYYAKPNREIFGPLTKQELADAGIEKSTPVWREGFENWMRADEMVELRTLFGGEDLPRTPPFLSHALAIGELENKPKPVVQERKADSSDNTSLDDEDVDETVVVTKRQTIWVTVGIVGLVLIIATVVIINYNMSKPPSDAESAAADSIARVETMKHEADSFTKYLYAQTSFATKPKNVLEVSGKITNSAKHTAYYNVVMKVRCKDIEDKTLRTYDKTLKDSFPAGSSSDFSIKVEKTPKGAIKYDAEIISATPTKDIK